MWFEQVCICGQKCAQSTAACQPVTLFLCFYISTISLNIFSSCSCLDIVLSYLKSHSALASCVLLTFSYLLLFLETDTQVQSVYQIQAIILFCCLEGLVEVQPMCFSHCSFYFLIIIPVNVFFRSLSGLGASLAGSEKNKR